MTKELLFSLTRKDFVIEPYKGSGPGGQHRNKTMLCVRIKHPESGAVAVGTEDRKQKKNRDAAFYRLIDSDKFQNWVKKKAAEFSLDKDYLHKQIEKAVEEWMKPEHIKIEYGPFNEKIK